MYNKYTYLQFCNNLFKTIRTLKAGYIHICLTCQKGNIGVTIILGPLHKFYIKTAPQLCKIWSLLFLNDLSLIAITV